MIATHVYLFCSCSIALANLKALRQDIYLGDDLADDVLGKQSNAQTAVKVATDKENLFAIRLSQSAQPLACPA